MPTDVSATTASSSAPAGEIRRLSNAVDDMTSPGIGPDQADCRVTSISYISFDYAGTMAHDPVVSVKATLLPIDGSNEGKEFDIEWTTGAKMSEFAIVDDGGYLAPTGSKNSLTNTSNWALLQNSLKDCSVDTKILNGPRGIRGLEGMEWTLRRIKQPERSGLDAKNAKGRDKEYYTCLKVITLPGEKKGAAGRKAPAAPKPAAAPAAAASAPANGDGGSSKLREYIVGALAANSGTLALDALAKAVFLQAKGDGLGARESNETAKLATEDYLIEQSMETPAPWTYDNGVLTAA
jgi:hypothetical protein